MQHDVSSLFRKYGPMIYRRSVVLLGNHADAEDAAQEVFVRAMRNLSEFEARCAVSTWLYAITTNVCLNVLRRRRVVARALENQATGHELPSLAPPLAEMLELRELLAEAEEQQALAAVYVYVDGMSKEEAAAVLGVSRRALGRLLERFSDWARARMQEGLGPIVPSSASRS